MKINKLLLSALFVISATASQAQGTNEVRLDGFSGQVQKVISTTYEAYLPNEETLQRGDVLERLQTVYSSNGQRKSMTYLSTEENIVFRTRYKHDAFGNTTLEQIVDNKEQVIGRTYYVYDQNLVLTETYVEDEERQIENRMQIRYDSQGRVSERRYNAPDNQIYRRESYTYDYDGTLQKTVVHDRQGHKLFELRYEYDSHRQPISLTTYDYTETEPEVYMTLFKYKYDSRGNWIQKTEYEVEDGHTTPQYITERSIQYFDN